MNISRRQIMRLLRLRNLLVITLLLMVLYMVKILHYMDDNNDYKTRVLGMLQMPQNLVNEKNYFVPTSLKKIDWHDFKLINEEKKRVGIGEQGLPAHLPKSDATIEQELYMDNGFNGALSDKISLNRSLRDIRHPKCAEKMYIASLPTVSVVVPFHNEHWSTLLRTAQSVLLRSPEKLIKEIFLVDDASTKAFLKEDLDAYLKKHMPKVKVIRLSSRSGLITARLAGAKKATGDVLVFLDSHTEANVNWLPPLLEPIALDYRTAMCPYIDVVAYDTFEYRAQDEGARGAFDWELFYKRLPLLPRDLKNMPEPFPSPVMAGGLFAISRAFFWELGGYDPGLDIWGGEQYELSFKIWQCGGRMLDAPCSRVGHIYRKFAPFPNPGHGDFVGKNYRRVAEVWMDEYARYIYARRPHYRNIDPGDISEQKALRQRLNCKSFRWFMTQIAFDLTYKYPPIEPEPFAKGRVRPVTNLNMCLDSNSGAQMDKVLIRPCEDSNSEQQYIFSWHKDVKNKHRNICWDLPESSSRSPIRLFPCHLGGGNQMWRLTKTKLIKHGHSDVCIDWDPVKLDVFINQCDPSVSTQQWTVDVENDALLDKWGEEKVSPTGPVEEA